MKNHTDWTNQDTWAIYRIFAESPELKQEAFDVLESERLNCQHETQLVPVMKEFVEDQLAEDFDLEESLTKYMGHHPYIGRYEGIAAVNWAEIIYRVFVKDAAPT